MEAKIIKDAIVIRATHILDAEFIVEVQGKYLGKTGGSSDRNYACYKDNIVLGSLINFYV